jgi:hypothetical protein
VSADPSPTPSILAQTEIRQDGDKFVFVVNGQPQIVKGMNYNVNYTELPEDTKRKLHRRDFQILRAAGVNAIIGWGIYDETTLEIAQEFGIGVIMPFELDPKGAYENENYREQIKYDYRDYVKRFRDFPAVWAWNVGGDELLYRMKTDEHRTIDKLQAAADFELELVVLSHVLDPKHVVIVKEPRDWYIRYLDESLRRFKTRADYQDPSAYLIYGVNVYGRLDDVETVLQISKGSVETMLGLGMLVSEFAPFLLPRADRPANYAAMWDIVSRVSSIGGCAYVFGPDQPNPNVPNPYDPLTLLPSEFSLVDMDGVPVDDSLYALAAKWRPNGTQTSADERGK